MYYLLNISYCNVHKDVYLKLPKIKNKNFVSTVESSIIFFFYIFNPLTFLQKYKEMAMISELTTSISVEIVGNFYFELEKKLRDFFMFLSTCYFRKLLQKLICSTLQ